MKKKWLTAIIIYFALIILCVAVIYVVPSVRGLLEKTYITEFGTIDISDEISGYIVRDERVYVASQDCKTERLAETGILTKAHTKIVRVKPIMTEDKETGEEIPKESEIGHKYKDLMEELGEEVTVTKKGFSKAAGYISYYIDGAENKLCTANLYDLTEKDLKELTGRPRVEVQKSKCAKGEPLFKIIKNSKWYLVFFIDNEDAEKYYVGRTVTADIGGKQVSVKVADIDAGDKTTRIALSCKTFYEDFYSTRTLDTVITVASADGLVLKDSSIVEKEDGQKGVFVKNKLGEHRFKPISIKADNGENCVAYSDIYVDEGGNFVETIGTYDEIVEEPTEEDIESLKEE